MEMQASHMGMLGMGLHYSGFLIQFLANVAQRQQEMVHMVVSQPLPWETQMEFLNLGFGLIHPQHL